MKHFQNEFEVQLRDGKVTLEGKDVLENLRDDFHILQASDRLEEIIVRAVGDQPHEKLSYKLKLVKSALQTSFSESLQKIQQVQMQRRRDLDNKLCAEKCKMGPVIYNFTSSEIPLELNEFLQDGLNNVPELDIDPCTVIAEVERDIKNACQSFFISEAGYYPRTFSIKDTLDTTIKNLIILEPCSNKISTSLISMRENYVAVKAQFMLKSRFNSNLSMLRIKNLIPSGLILSPSDKKEYKSQVETRHD